MLVIDSCQAKYQTLLITYQKFTIRNANHAWTGKKNRSECEFIGFKNGRLNYKCKECGKKCTKLKNDTIKNFPIMHQFCNSDLNKTFLLLRKSVSPYEDMNSWEKFDETSIPPKKSFLQRTIKNRCEYHDLYVQCDTLLLEDVFENSIDKCIEIYGLDSARFLTAPELAWQACLKERGVKLELLTDIDSLLMVENGIRG